MCWNGSASYPSCCNPACLAAPHRGRLEQKASKYPPSAWGSIVSPPRKTSSAVYHNPQHESSLWSKQGKNNSWMFYCLFTFWPKLDQLRKKMQDKWDLENTPACPTTCSHCWGFLGVMGRRDEVPQLLCFFHAEFCIRKKTQKTQRVITEQTHIPDQTSLVPVFFCVFPDRQQGPQTSDSIPLTFCLMVGQRLHGNSP